MTAPRIAYLCGEYPRATDTFIQREVAALREAGMHVDTMAVRRPSANERGTAEQEEERQRTHYLLPCSPLRLIADHAALLVRSPGRYLRGVWLALTVRSPGLVSLVYQLFYFAEAGLVAGHMRRNGLTHVHNHAPDRSGYVTMIAAELGGFTYSLVLHGFGILSEPNRWRLGDKLERSLFAICVSWYARSQAMLWTDRRHWSRYHVVHCGIDPATIEPRQHSGRGKRLLFVGRFDHVKGLPLLLDVVGELATSRREIHLDLAGDGPQRADLEAIVSEKRLEKHVTFHGYLSQAALREQYQSADVCVMTSFAEGIPVVLMEAMAAGVPVVAPRVAGIAELVEDGRSGLLYPAGCGELLTNAIERLLDDADERNALGAAGRRMIEREFRLSDEVQRLVQIMQKRMAGEDVAARPDIDEASIPEAGDTRKPAAQMTHHERAATP